MVIDIETASLSPDFQQLPDRLKPEWLRKARKLAPDSDPEEAYAEKAALLAEFGKVVVIGAGFFYQDEQKTIHFRVKTFANHDEKMLLLDFKQLVEDRFDANKLTLVAHNGRDFDYPFLCRRLLINGIKPPKALQLLDKKPWDIPHHDTMQMWRFGESRHYVSLELLAGVFGIPSSKSDLDGSQVSQVYHQTADLERIAAYCADDVIATAKVYLKLNVLPDLPDENIVKVS